MDIGYNTVNTCMLWLWWMIIFYNIRPWHQLKCLYHFYNHPYSSTNDLNHMFLKRVTKIDLDPPPFPEFFKMKASSGAMVKSSHHFGGALVN